MQFFRDRTPWPLGVYADHEDRPFISLEYGRVHLDEGDWIVELEREERRVHTADEFAKLYEPIESPSSAPSAAEAALAAIRTFIPPQDLAGADNALTVLALALASQRPAVGEATAEPVARQRLWEAIQALRREGAERPAHEAVKLVTQRIDDYQRAVLASPPPSRAGEPTTNPVPVSSTLVVASRAGEATEAWQPCPYCQHPESCRDRVLVCVEPAMRLQRIERGVATAMEVFHEHQRTKREIASPAPAGAETVELERTLAKIKQAEALVSDLNHGRRQWRMSIPAQPNYDPDLVIGDALHWAASLLAGRAGRESEPYFKWHMFKPTEFGGETCAECGHNVRGHIPDPSARAATPEGDA